MVKQYTTTLTTLLIGLVCTMPLLAEAATLYLSPSSGNHYKGESFEVKVLVNADVAINAASGVLNFPTQYLNVVDVSKKDSILNFWVEEPSFSNAGNVGNIRFQGVALNPGFTGNGGEIAIITFRSNSTGAATVNFIQSSILANDGLGTNVVASATGAQFTLLPPRAAPPSAQTIQTTQKPQVIVITPLPPESFSDILSFWKTAPALVQASILVFLGLAAIISSLIILSFGVVVLVWLWSNVWHQRHQFLATIRIVAHAPKDAVLKIAHFFGMAEREVEGDVHYSTERLAEALEEMPHAPSFKTLVKEYFLLVFDIVKRFVTTQNPYGDTPNVRDGNEFVYKKTTDIEKDMDDAEK